MTFSSIISFIAAAFSCGMAAYVFFRERQSFAHRIFALGMVALALEALFTGISLLDMLPDELARWQHVRLTVTAFIPGLWLIFSLTYARVNYETFLRKYRWVILATFIIPFILHVFFWKAFLTAVPVPGSPLIVLRLGWAGYYFHLCSIISAVLILMNLEKTLRESIGHMRWQVKFMALGMGGLFAVRLYTDTQTILFRYASMELQLVNCVTLLIAGALVLKSLLRARLFAGDFYVSQSFLFNSITLLLAGIYLLFVGLVAKAVNYFGGGIPLFLHVSLVFLVALGVSTLFLSDRVRRRLKRLVSLHLRRPFYDYRKEWSEFTQATTSVADVRSMCVAVAKKLSTTFETLSVTIWLTDEKGDTLVFGGSTALSEVQARKIIENKSFASELIALMRRQQEPIELFHVNTGLAEEMKKNSPEDLKRFKALHCVPLRVSDTLLGFVVLDGRVEGQPLSVEDYDLLKTIGDQTAGILMNFKLAEHLRQLKETEAYQTMSAFMMHDLKNLASNLSLTMQNLPIHFDNPEFREDALRMIQQSVTRLNTMCSRLSMLSQKIELKPVETDLNELLRSTLPCLNGLGKGSLVQGLQALPNLLIDPEQVQKVLTNLLLNAHDAVGEAGEIRVASESRDGWAILSISDNGPGMSKEFIENFLFRPFKTTKKQGMGIGLYQSKMIVEAHGGRIEVESEEGKRTTFRVYLPVGKPC
jgi:putative PEP-CTERM system histidine kinase